MLFFGIAEYAAVSRATSQAIDFYKGVGAVEAEPPKRDNPKELWPDYLPSDIFHAPVYSYDFYLYADDRVAYNPYGEEIRQYSYTGLSKSNIDAIVGLPGVSRTSVRYMTAGISASLSRKYDIENYFKYTDRYIAEATFFDIYTIERMPGQDEGIEYRLTFSDLTLLAGDFETFNNVRGNNSGMAILYAKTFDRNYADGGTFPEASIVGSTTPLVRSVIHGNEVYRSETYSSEFLESLVPGERYVIIGRFSPLIMGDMVGNIDMSLSDPMTLDWCPQIYPLKDLPENYIDLSEFSPLREIIKLTNTDIHTLDVVYTDEMPLIMRFAEGSMTLTEGRALTVEDSEHKNNVCVMNSKFMLDNGIKIGDRITLSLGDKLFEQNPTLGAVSVVRERYPDSFKEEEFEIVGAYRDVDTPAKRVENLHWSYSINTVFVPMPFLPVKVPDDHVVRPGEFSFVIDDPRDISAFLEESRGVIEVEHGLTLFFSDGGWSAVESMIRQTGVSALVRLIALSLSAAVAAGLTAYLFVWRKRKEYAIMRALGTTMRVANRSLYIPLGVLGLIATAVGTILGRATAAGSIEDVLAQFTEAGIEAESRIPGYTVIISFVCALAALALFTSIMLRNVGAKSPLELLQVGENMTVAGAGGRRTRHTWHDRHNQHDQHTRHDMHDGANAVTLHANESSASTATVSEIRKPVTQAKMTSATRLWKKQSPVRHTVGYVARHIRRTSIKSLLSAGLTLLLIGAVGQLTVVRGMYKDLYHSIEQEAHIVGGISLLKAVESAAYEQLKAVYFEHSIKAVMTYHSDTNIVVTNDIARFSGEAAEIEFLDGYSYVTQGVIEKIYDSANKTCVMDDSLMRSLKLELGDTVRFISLYDNADIYRDQFGLPSLDITAEELQKNYEFLEPQFNNASVFFTVVGRDVSDSAPNTVYLPLTRAITPIIKFPKNEILDYAEYILTSPEYAEEFRLFTESMIIGPTVGDVGSPFIMDTSEADNILGRVKLLDAVYPIAAAIAVVISGLLPALSVMQSTKDAAIMRALGTTKRRARATIVLEQSALCLAGFLCAAIVLPVVNGTSMSSYLGAIGINAAAQFAACVAGALICAVAATRRRVLELLQVKE